MCNMNNHVTPHNYKEVGKYGRTHGYLVSTWQFATLELRWYSVPKKDSMPVYGGLYL